MKANCPFCGKEAELDFNEGMAESHFVSRKYEDEEICMSCGGSFAFSVEFDVDYWMGQITKLEAPENEEEWGERNFIDKHTIPLFIFKKDK